LVALMTADLNLLAPDSARDEGLVAEVVSLVNEAYAVGEAGLWVDGWTRTESGEISEAIGSGGILTAALDGRIVGCAYVHPLEPGVADLGLISAATDRWGSGIGGELVRAAEELMRSRGVTTMQLELLVPIGWVHPQKARLQSWYTRLGYEVVRTAPFEEVARHLASELATPCQFLIFHKPL
jgi:ribosomal protein S18 acetylase RimI-like enzyme